MIVKQLDHVGLKKLIEDTTLKSSNIPVIAFPDAIDSDYAVSYSLGGYAKSDLNNIPFVPVRMHKNKQPNVIQHGLGAIDFCFYSAICDVMFANFLSNETDIDIYIQSIKKILTAFNVKVLLVFGFESVVSEYNGWQYIIKLQKAASMLDLPIVLVLTRSYAKFLRANNHEIMNAKLCSFYECNFGDSKYHYDIRVRQYIKNSGLEDGEVNQQLLDNMFDYTKGNVSESFKILSLIQDVSYKSNNQISLLNPDCLNIYLNA